MEKSTKESLKQFYPTFQSQAEAIDYVREGLSHHVGDHISHAVNAEYYKELILLLGCHPDFERKFNAVDVFEIIPLHSERDNVFMLALETNKGNMDVSWRKCAANLVRIQKSKQIDQSLFLRQSVLRAMRLEIQDQMQEFRKKHKQKHRGRYINALSGHYLSPECAVVDHFPKPFSQIADEWLDHVGGITEVQLQEDQNYRGRKMSDQKQRTSWKMYHLLEARYRIISAKQNSRNGAYGYKARN